MSKAVNSIFLQGLYLIQFSIWIATIFIVLNIVVLLTELCFVISPSSDVRVQFYFAVCKCTLDTPLGQKDH